MRTPRPDKGVDDEGCERSKYCRGMSARRRPMNVRVPDGVGFFSPRRIRSKGFFFWSDMVFVWYTGFNRCYT